MMLGTGEIIILLLYLSGTILWIIALIRIASAEQGAAQKVWLVFVALTHVFGALVYLGYNQFVRQK
jgi:hypothetical protein